MIKIDRSSVLEPELLATRGRREFEKLRAFYAANPQLRTQREPPKDLAFWTDKSVKAALVELFKGKCAFCESTVSGVGYAQVEHFRPKQRAAQLDGQVDPDHYWWLTYSWSNLYLICQLCNMAKATRFPVIGKRAEYNVEASIEQEQTLLLDPCRDNPDQSLDFSGDGTVRALDERGQITIDVYTLNRPQLVRLRRNHAKHVDLLSAECRRRMPANDWTENNLFAAVAAEVPDSPYMALTRCRVNKQAGVRRAIPVRHHLFSPSRGITEGDTARGAVWLSRIHIENFRALRRVSLEFPSDFSLVGNDTTVENTELTSQPWLMLLGENGVGKSSILKAIALALIPTAQRGRYAVESREWVSLGSRAKAGAIRLEFSSGAEPIELHFSRHSRKVVVKGHGPPVAVLGYGSTRLLPEPSPGASQRPERVRIENLFNPRAALHDAENWLSNKRSVGATEFNLIATSLKTLLSLGDDDQLTRQNRRLYARLHGATVPIRALSDGYQSVLALAMDIVLNLSKTTFDMEAVEALVLLDEIEAHLHPRWKIAIVTSLRKLFPRVRFIATTHDPLCVQGIRKGELHVMTRQGSDHRVQVDQFDVPPGLIADEILTGAWFGLNTTRDPETVSIMCEHGALLQETSRTRDQQKRFEYLDQQLRRRVLDYVGTAEEQVALRVAADVRAQEDSKRRPKAANHELLRAKIIEALRPERSAADSEAGDA
jgi:uncharacterized protein (TIGR02646 family)